MLTNCLHCERRPAVPGRDLGLCHSCTAMPAVAVLYVPRPHHTPAFLDKLLRLAGRYRLRLPLFPEGDRRHPLFG